MADASVLLTRFEGLVFTWLAVLVRKVCRPRREGDTNVCRVMLEVGMERAL